MANNLGIAMRIKDISFVYGLEEPKAGDEKILRELLLQRTGPKMHSP